MKRLFAAESLRWRILLRFAAWAVLIVLILRVRRSCLTF